MSALLVLLLGRVLVAAVDQPAPAMPVILFVAPGASNAGESRALLDTVAIYTRDLRVKVQVVPDNSALGRSAARVDPLIRAHGAHLAFWYTRGSTPHTLTLFLLNAHGTLRTELVTGGGAQGADLHRIIALKLRAALTGEQRKNPIDLPRTPHATGPLTPTATPAVASTVPSRPPPSVGAGTESTTATRTDDTVVVHRSHAPAAEIPRFFAAAGYRASRAPGHAAFRQALALEGVGTIGQSLEMGLGIELSPAGESTLVAGGTMSVRDTPLRLAACWVHHGSKMQAGVGPFASAHFLAASADSSDGRHDWSLTLASGFGLEGVVRTAFVGRSSLDLRASIEAYVPRTRFLVDQNSAFDTGSVAFGLGLGIAFPTR